ncbi:hypothetical protein CTI14_44780, partial [Methylobacterium radiotolerans]
MTPGRAWEFAAGGLIAVVGHRLRERGPQRGCFHRPALLVAVRGRAVLPAVAAPAPRGLGGGEEI